MADATTATDLTQWEVLECVEWMLAPKGVPAIDGMCLTYAIGIKEGGQPQWFRRTILDPDDEMTPATHQIRPDVLVSMREAHLAIYAHWRERLQQKEGQPHG